MSDASERPPRLFVEIPIDVRDDGSADVEGRYFVVKIPFERVMKDAPEPLVLIEDLQKRLSLNEAQTTSLSRSIFAQLVDPTGPWNWDLALEKVPRLSKLDLPKRIKASDPPLRKYFAVDVDENMLLKKSVVRPKSNGKRKTSTPSKKASKSSPRKRKKTTS